MRTKILFMTIIVLNLMPVKGIAQGFEKNGLWDARSASLAGSGVTFNGIDSLYLNPAGLWSLSKGHQVSVNFSPTSSQSEQPINNQNSPEKSALGFGPAGGLLYGFSKSDRWGIGFGYYAIGGGQGNFSQIAFSDFQGGTVNSTFNLAISEASIGAGYKLTNEFSVGFGLRYTMYSFDYNQPTRALDGAALAEPNFVGMKGADASAFRIGFQYIYSPRLVVGLSFRSQSSATLNGRLTGGRVLTKSAAPMDMGSGSAQTAWTLPQSITLGAQYDLNPKWKMWIEYNWTQYSKIATATMTSDNPLVGSQSHPLNWRDMHRIRLAFQYGSTTPLRFGYAYSSQVTDSLYANTGFPPAPTNSFSVGSGFTTNLFGKFSRFDYGFDYSTTSVVAGASGAGDPTFDSRYGNYNLWILGVHTSLTWKI